MPTRRRLWRISCSFRSTTIFIILSMVCSGLCLPVLEGEEPDRVCSTEICKNAASSILKNMKKDISPCDDFYEFVCGNYLKSRKIPEDQAMVNFVADFYDKIERELKNDIEEKSPEIEPETLKKLKNYYQSCIDETEADGVKETRFLKMLGELGDWPVLVGDSWNQSTFNWVEATLKFRRAGFKFDQFINFDIRVDSKNHTRNLIHIDGPSLGIDRQYLVMQDAENGVLKAYSQFMTKYAETLKANHDTAISVAEDVLKFEISLAKISPTKIEKNDAFKNYNLMSIQNLSGQYPQIPWLDLLNGLSSPSVHLGISDEIILTSPRYLTELIQLISTTSNRTLANYAYWRVAQSSAKYVSQRIRKLARGLDTAIYGVTKEMPRSTECIIRISEDLPIATGALYVRKHFNIKTKQDVVALFEKLRGKLHGMIEEVQDMGYNEKIATQDKLNNTIPLIGYPDELFDNKTLDKYHESISVSPRNYLKSILSIQLARDLHMFKALKKPVERLDWTGTFGATAVVNALNRLETNTIEFPAGILQGSVFNVGYPNYMNYGAVGPFLGHEISHGFINSGRFYNKYGELKNSLNNETDARYLKKAECIVNQLGNSTMKDMADANLGYVEEIVADIGGLEVAYSAYQDWKKGHGEDPRLPGLEDYTPEQMFWIANGNMWCTKYRPETLADLIRSGDYLPAQERVVGPMSNQIKFSEDFQCSEASRMNATHKCSLWL